MKNKRVDFFVLLIAVAAWAMAGCQVAERDEGDGDRLEAGVRYLEVALAAQQEGETRTGVSDGGTTVSWSSGDAIAVFCGERSSRLANSPSSVSQFTGNLPVDISTMSAGDYVWGLYPYDASAAFNSADNRITTSLPAVQTAKAGSFDDNLMILVGRTALTQTNLSQNPVTLSMTFKNVCSGVRFQVTRSDIKTVTMRAIGGENLCGTVQIGLDGSGNPTVSSVTDGSSSIVLDAPGNGTFTAGQWYYFVTLPGTLSQGAEFTMTTDTKEGIRTVSSNIALARKEFRQAANLDSGIAFNDLFVEVQVATPDTWVAEDELGRAMPGLSEAGALKSNRHIVLFYSNWHCDSRFVEGNLQATQVNYSAIFNVETMKQQYSEAPDLFYNSSYWSPLDPADPTKFPYLMGYAYNQIAFWGTPLFGYYRTTDPWVLRKHAEMLADAGVDAVAFDCSNGHFLWEASVDAMLSSWAQAKRDGVNVPKMMFILNFYITEDTAISLRRLYEKYYSNPAYDDMWFHLEGDPKPLVMAYKESLGTSGNDVFLSDFFTYRAGQGDYVNGDRSAQDMWGWMQTFYGDDDVETFHGEEITVSVAQNSCDLSEGHCFAFNVTDGQGHYTAYGRSYTHANGHNQMTSTSYRNGYNFQEQWDNALAKDPPYVFVTEWNEWIAAMQYQWPEDDYTYGGWGPPAFADQFDWEHSRDIEPTLDWGDHGDNYYYQMAKNIRMYKGVSAYPNVSASETMAIDGDFTGWDHVSPDFRHYPGNTLHRAHQGHTEHELAFYRNSSGRNDIVDARVTRDADYVYFYVETAANITSYTGARWMRLLINKDMDWSTGWKGYDYCLNFETPASPTQGYISQCSGTSWSWTRQGTFNYRVTGNKMELRIPRSLFPSGKLDFAFKWADNNLEEWGGARETRILNLYVDGDAAPGGRFNFHYVEP